MARGQARPIHRLPPVLSVASARLRACAVIGIGLLLALAATSGPLPPAGGEPGASLTVRLPDAVRTLALALLALAVLILIAMQRRRRPSEDTARGRRDQRRSAWAAALVPPLVLMSLVALWYFVWHRWSGSENNPIEAAFTAIADLLDLLALARKPPTSMPFFDFTIATLVLLAALAIFAFMVLVALADRLERWWAGRRTDEAAPPLADEGPADGLEDLRTVADSRVAIIRVWRRFEQALAAARAPRAPWQTPAEFMRTALVRRPVPLPAVRRLTTLFEIARFSDHPLGAEARDTACDCLDEITRALQAAEEGERAR